VTAAAAVALRSSQALWPARVEGFLSFVTRGGESDVGPVGLYRFIYGPKPVNICDFDKKKRFGSVSSDNRFSLKEN
jgi:hypothetical protein